jgi:2-methylisocitrate lyase-like PEP mutase family enzyme
MTSARRLRELLARPGLIRTIGVHDVFSARLAEQAGMEMLFLGGFGVAASSFGLPDVGLVTLTEMTDAVRRVAGRVGIPVIADGDTGHGDLHNVVRTVREFEQAGAAGLLLEDQVSPKRCGHFEGKSIIPADEMVLKLKAALSARRDPDFIVVARTDARAIEGIDGAISRAQRYHAVGADICFIEAPTSIEELRRIPREVKCPLLVNMLTGGATPILPMEELERLGYKIGVYPIETLMVAGAAIRRLLNAVLKEGVVDPRQEMLTFAEVKEVLGLREILSVRDRLT